MPLLLAFLGRSCSFSSSPMYGRSFRLEIKLSPALASIEVYFRKTKDIIQYILGNRFRPQKGSLWFVYVGRQCTGGLNTHCTPP